MLPPLEADPLRDPETFGDTGAAREMFGHVPRRVRSPETFIRRFGRARCVRF